MRAHLEPTLALIYPKPPAGPIATSSLRYTTIRLHKGSCKDWRWELKLSESGSASSLLAHVFLRSLVPPRVWHAIRARTYVQSISEHCVLRGLSRKLCSASMTLTQSACMASRPLRIPGRTCRFREAPPAESSCPTRSRNTQCTNATEIDCTRTACHVLRQELPVGGALRKSHGLEYDGVRKLQA